MAQLVLGTAGAIAGGLLGGPWGAMAGWSVGSLLGGMLFRGPITGCVVLQPAKSKTATPPDVLAKRVPDTAIRFPQRSRLTNRITRGFSAATEKLIGFFTSKVDNGPIDAFRLQLFTYFMNQGNNAF
jgi:hypothetical protein